MLSLVRCFRYFIQVKMTRQRWNNTVTKSPQHVTPNKSQTPRRKPKDKVKIWLDPNTMVHFTASLDTNSLKRPENILHMKKGAEQYPLTASLSRLSPLPLLWSHGEVEGAAASSVVDHYHSPRHEPRVHFVRAHLHCECLSFITRQELAVFLQTHVVASGKNHLGKLL